MTAEKILAIGPDILSHVNGGPAALSDDQIGRLIAETPAAVEVTFVGNLRALRVAVEMLAERGELARLIVGSDMPSGSGFLPAAILYTLAYLCSQTAVAPAQAVAMATGNPARILGIPGGRIAAGEVADFLVIDALVGSAGRDALEALAMGDVVGVGLVVLRGEVAVWPSRYTPRPRRACVLERGAIEGHRA
jgi:enamidase